MSVHFGMALSPYAEKRLNHIESVRALSKKELASELKQIKRLQKRFDTYEPKNGSIRQLVALNTLLEDVTDFVQTDPGLKTQSRRELISKHFLHWRQTAHQAVRKFIDSLSPQKARNLLNAVKNKDKFPKQIDQVFLSAPLLARAEADLTQKEISAVNAFSYQSSGKIVHLSSINQKNDYSKDDHPLPVD